MNEHYVKKLNNVIDPLHSLYKSMNDLDILNEKMYHETEWLYEACDDYVQSHAQPEELNDDCSSYVGRFTGTKRYKDIVESIKSSKTYQELLKNIHDTEDVIKKKKQILKPLLERLSSVIEDKWYYESEVERIL